MKKTEYKDLPRAVKIILIICCLIAISAIVIRIYGYFNQDTANPDTSNKITQNTRLKTSIDWKKSTSQDIITYSYKDCNIYYSQSEKDKESISILFEHDGEIYLGLYENNSLYFLKNSKTEKSTPSAIKENMILFRKIYGESLNHLPQEVRKLFKE